METFLVILSTIAIGLCILGLGYVIITIIIEKK